MSVFDTIFAGSSGVANQLLGLFGVKGIFTHVENNVSKYDPISDIFDESCTTVSKEVSISPILQYSTYERVNSTIEEGDCKIIGYYDDFGTISNMVDTIKVNGKVFVIVSSKFTYSGDKIPIVTLQVRERKNG